MKSPSASLSVSTGNGTADNEMKFVEDLLHTSTCNVLEVSSDDEFSVACLGTASSCD